VQLGSQASGLTEVAVILSIHPEWDRGPHQLNFPALTKDGNVDLKVDHINPRSWRGNVEVEDVNLCTCWMLGRQKAIKHLPAAGPVFQQLFNDGLDMLKPTGTLLVNQRDLDDKYDCSELEAVPSPTPDSSAGHLAPTIDSTVQNPPSTSDEGDTEDAMAEEEPCGSVTSKVIINGITTTKLRALRDRMKYQTNRSSTDRLKHVQQLPCFDNTTLTNPDIVSFDSALGAPCLHIGNPVAVLVRCEDLIFLTIAQINRLQFASEHDLQDLPLHLLADPTAKISFQILRLIPATTKDNRSHQYDWCWSQAMDACCDNIPGQLIHPVNPTISLQTSGKPTFLFESHFLMTMAATLYQELLPQDRRGIPTVKQSEFFPYRSSGMLYVYFIWWSPIDPICTICSP
jgi:hypothetical protein